MIMSAFLGPIHYWLYNKIQHQDSILNDIYKSYDQAGLQLKEEANKLYGSLEEGPLDEIIDQSNIHGWLQERVSQVEYNYAYVITKLLEEDQTNLNKLKSILKASGEKEGQKLVGSSPTAKDLYKLSSECLLDGMPCDRANELLDNTDSLVSWKRNLCVHEQYWQEIGGDINIYYDLRHAWMEGLTADYDFRFTKTNSDLYKIEAI